MRDCVEHYQKSIPKLTPLTSYQMFNFLFKQTPPLFATEKELILHVIRFATGASKIYNRHALPEWKAQYSRKEGYMFSHRVLDSDYKLICELAKTSDDEEILRAIYDTHRDGFLSLYIGHIRYPKLYLNVHLPDDLIYYYINSAYCLIEDLSEEGKRLNRMLKVGFSSVVNEKIQRRIDEIVIIKRKKKEDKTKDKLKAYLITAAATKSVFTGNSIDDVIEASINDNVDDQVLDYMNKLFGDKK